MLAPLSSDVEMRIKRVAPIADDDLVDVADEIMATLETAVADVAVGPVVAVDLPKRMIGIRFFVDSKDHLDANRRLTRVAEAIDGVLKADDEVCTTTATGGRASDDLACVF